MRPQIGLLALLTLLATVNTPWPLNLSVLFSTTEALAQTQEVRKAQAERSHQQGVEQFRAGQFRAALQSFQQALTIYREIGDKAGVGKTLNNMGAVYTHLSQYPTALETLQQALAIHQEVKDRKGEGETLNNMGEVYFELSQYPKALEILQQALAIGKEVGDKAGVGEALNNIGAVYTDLNQYPKALETLQQALAIRREVGDRFREGETLARIGLVYNNLGDRSRALEVLEQALAINKQVGNRFWEGVTIYVTGLVYNSQGKPSQALSLYQQALGMLKEMGYRNGEGITLSLMGWSYNALNDYGKAIEFFGQSLTIARQLQNRQGEQQALSNLGSSYYSLKDYGKAIEYYQQSLTLARELHNRQGEQQALSNLGWSYNALNDYAKAVEYHEQGLQIAKKISDRQGEQLAMFNLGYSYYWLNDYAKAISYYEQSLELARKSSDRNQWEANILHALGEVFYYLGNYTKAIDYNKQGLAISRQVRDRDVEAKALNSLGNAFYKLDNLTQAREYYEQALAISREIGNRNVQGNALSGLGSAYSQQGDYAKAIDYHKQSLQISRQLRNRYNEGVSLSNLGTAYFNLGDYGKAIDYYKQRLAISQGNDELYGKGFALLGLGLAFSKSGNLPQAETSLRDGIEALESIRKKLPNNDGFKVSIFETQLGIYRTLQKVLIAQNKPDAALEIAERGRARAFVELLASRLQVDLSHVKGDSQPSNLKPPTIEQIKQIAKTQNSTLVQYSIIQDDFKVEGKQKTKESELYIWVIQPTGEVTFRKADLKPLWQQQNMSLEDLVIGSRDTILGGRGIFIVDVIAGQNSKKNQSANQVENLQQLHKLLIEPIADLLPKDPNQRVAFMPIKSLFLVPFGALQDKDGKYLIEKHTILTAPSIQVLQLTHQQRQRVEKRDMASLQAQDAIVVGNPTMPSLGKPPKQLQSLSGAEQEALAIAPMLKTKALTGNEATKAALMQRMGKARIIHLATHGLLDEDQGLGSAIALAPSGKDNGLLTAEQILNLKLSAAELVVLSACNTGRGRITGDGVIGLSRSLISAGVPSVLVSLWAVNDTSTKFLMTEFYHNLQKNPDKAQALRQAMLATMKQQQYSNPIHWAAFTLIGEAD